MHDVALTYGASQAFRPRLADLTVQGMVRGLSGPPGPARWRLNGGPWQPLYVEADEDPGVDWLNGYKASPAELRLRHRGEFCVEIPVDAPDLREGPNALVVEAEAEGRAARAEARLDWDPTPLPAALDLSDLSALGTVTELGQGVNGAFDLDRAAGCIRSRAPVAPDALLVLGGPHATQEATYRVRFLEPPLSKWLGLSDFHAGMTEGVPPRGLKVGWCSAGMAVAMGSGGARSFLAWGDHGGGPDEWAVATNPPAPFEPEPRRAYRVRHQVLIEPGRNRVRFRIWPEVEVEPDAWTCDENAGALPAGLPRPDRASFALFQHMGMPVEWSDIRLAPLDPAAFGEDPPGREPFLRRVRPGAF
jgi:hypothetical protein